MLDALIGILFLFADQLLKFWTVSHIELNAFPGKELIPGVLNMTYIKNTGMAFGLFSKFSGLRWVLLALLAAFTAFIVLGIVMRYLRTGFARFTGTMLLAGLLGNGIDRAIYGYVVDMFEPKLGSITWPIFNLADCLVVIFGILFCIAVLAGGLGAPDEDWDEEDEDDEDEEEEEKPSRRRSRRSRDEDEEEEPVRRPRRAPREEDAPVRRVRRDEEDEDRPRRRVRREEEEEAPVRRRSSAEAPVRRRPAEEARPVRRSEPRPAQPEPTREAQPARRNVSRPVAEAEAVVRTVERPAARPAATPAAPAARPAAPAARPAAPAARPAAPAAKPAAEKPVSAPKASDEFDLDSILAEFK